LYLDRLGRLYGRHQVAFSIGGFSGIVVDLVDFAGRLLIRLLGQHLGAS